VVHSAEHAGESQAGWVATMRREPGQRAACSRRVSSAPRARSCPAVYRGREAAALCPGAPPTSGRGPGCVVPAHASARHGCAAGGPGGAVVSLSVGSRTLVPGAPARGADGAVARADGAARTACPSDVQERGLASPPHAPGGPGLSRGVLCGRLGTPGVSHPVYAAASLSPASAPAPTPRDGTASCPARRVLSPAGRR